jgi:HEAT repeat protein
MTERIRLALQIQPDNPQAGPQALRKLLAGDPEQFLRAFIPLLHSERDRPAYQPLIKFWIQTRETVQQLCNPELFDKETAIELARVIAEMDPGLDTRLVRSLPTRGGMETSNAVTGAVAERVLELVEAISGGARTLPSFAHLMRDPNPRLRAKAALLIGRRVHSARWVEQRLNEPDARVRANVVESFWGQGGGWAVDVLCRAADDPNNRVAGNALCGLYDLKQHKAVPYILRMATDARPAFRATAAWTMGKTGSPEFMPALEKLSHDLYAAVRKNAVKAMDRIRQRETADRLEMAG